MLQAELEPIRTRRKEWQKDIPAVYEILRKGSEKAEKVAAETLRDVKAAMEDQLLRWTRNTDPDAVGEIYGRIKNHMEE